MTTNNEAFKAYLNKFKHVTGGLRVYSELNEHEKSIAKDAWQAATTEANKRMAELEQMYRGAKILLDFNTQKNPFLKEMAALDSEVAELKVKLNDYIKITNCQSEEILLIQTKNNVLNNAIGKSLSCVAEEINPNNYNGEILTNFIYDYGRMVDILNEALSATPAESLQAFENEVIEKCAKVCDKWIGLETVAEVIRSLKEVK